MSILPALLVAVLGALAIEAASPPRPISRRPGDLSIRLASYALIAAFWFQFTWRPWLAAVSCLITLAGGTAINRLKRRVIGESLVFSDLALLRQVPRHPELYYALPLSDVRVIGLILGGIAAVALWCATEPPALPRGAFAGWIAAVALPLAFVALVLLARQPILRDRLARRFARPDLERDVRRYGLFATMMAYSLRRDAERRSGAARAPTAASTACGGPDDEVFIVVQLESFLDPERLGCAPLPLMARIRAEAMQYGRLRVSAHGAYTMRSEHAVLTGRDAEALGFGGFDPYLAFGGDEPTSLALRARAAGYAATFVHPYHRDFFNRARVVSRLGFERLVMEEDFAGAARVGPYVGDLAFAERLLAEVRARSGPLFLFAVSMENHGPWKPGRLPGIDDPLAQYRHHLAHSGRAVELLIEGLSGLRATLCVFGDHPPSLPANRPSAAPPETDYAIFRFGRAAAGRALPVDLTAAELGRWLGAALVGEASGLPGREAVLPRS